MDNRELSQRIREENIRVHRQEADLYDVLHSYIFNAYEQSQTWRDVRFIARQLLPPNPTALDIGCGTGNLSLKFLRLGFSVLGVDISPEMVAVLRRKHRDPRLGLVVCDIDSFLRSHRGSYDVIAISSVLHHLPAWEETLGDCYRLLKGAGYLYITHEPTVQAVSQGFWERFDRYDTWLFYRLMSLRKKSIPPVSYLYSDYLCYHGERGINSRRLHSHLKHCGFQVLRYREYNVGRFALSSLIKDKLNPQKELFRLTALRSR